MSLDVDLYDGDSKVFDRNITHNLNKMADAAGIYECLWRPEDLGITHACNLIAPLSDGLTKLVLDKSYYSTFNPENGWGDWEALVMFCAAYLEACKKYPDARIEVSR